MSSLPYYTKGDNSALLLKATTDGTTPWDLTGATFSTTFEKWDGGDLVIADGDHSITSAANGEYQINWDENDTVLLKSREKVVFKTEITQTGVTHTLWFDCVLEVRESKISKQGQF